MKHYNYKLAKKIIQRFIDLTEVTEVYMGMSEDWFCTADVVWRDGKFLKELPDNIKEIEAEYREKRKAGVSIMSGELDKYNEQFIGGILGSHWATPVIQITTKDGQEHTFNCYESDGIDADIIDKIEMQFKWAGGCLSGPVQNSREEIEIKDFKE